MAKKRNRITSEMSKTIAESSPLIKKATTKVVTEDSNNLIEVGLNLLIDNPFQPRIDINVHSLNELISSIEQNGLLQPIVITEKNEDGKHIIIAGHRRYEAFKIMGRDSIKATTLKDIADKDLAILSLTENLMRENLHPIENAIAIKNILDNNIVESQNKLAEYVGLSKGYVSKLMNILKLPTSIIQVIKDDNYTDINILLLLNKLDDVETMLTVYKYVKNLTRSEAEKYIKINYLEQKTQTKEVATIKTSKSKIALDINIKMLSSEENKEVLNKIEKLQHEIESLYAVWGK
ncbi:ParB/RepB/Spo0J family partition protein (plasmid) [Sulfurimonas aquatica]|uniref:ParB/RepB/Spo0J family partition protein n=1 Tax=Sulfurimonas aquatica TaxID=2672570 RepID=A0A975GDW3_9BACT|nr:ParB/RepB/Spo0J family partition protein [Sulfurimonas aquatica]QSZ43146.1 ParB/RepB/Spo0J family partition protein [Sulfurimonas aquatica]